MRYIIYTRVSSNKQTVENQLHECRQYVYRLRQKGDEIIEFSEPDKSTQKPMAQRKKLMEMLSKIRKGDQLVVYKVDRLARDKQELVNIYCNIKKMGVEIFGIKDPSLNDDTILMYAMIASHERTNIQQRTKSGLERKRANGEKVGGNRYGYSVDQTQLQTQRETVHSFNKPYLVIPEPIEAQQVALMAQLHREGHSYGEIERVLEEKGFRNRKGNPVHKSTVYRVLKRLNNENQAPQASEFAMSH